MTQRTVIVMQCNEMELPSARIYFFSHSFSSNITLVIHDPLNDTTRKVAAKSRLGLLSVESWSGLTVDIIAEGVDEENAVEGMAQLLTSKLTA